MYQTIQSRDNPRIKQACQLAKSGQARQREGLFYAEGLKLCRDIAQNTPPKALFVTEKLLGSCGELAQAAGEVFVVSESVAQKLAETKTPQGVVCLFGLPPARAGSPNAEDGVLVCEALQDPANVGAVLRSAAGLGFGGVLLTPGCADPFSPKALRAGMGAALRLPLWQNLPMGEAAALLKEKGATLYAAALQGAVPLNQAARTTPYALLVGNEGAGLTPEALAAADARVFIPMKNGVESLNAAAAAALLMFYMKMDGF